MPCAPHGAEGKPSSQNRAVFRLNQSRAVPSRAPEGWVPPLSPVSADPRLCFGPGERRGGLLGGQGRRHASRGCCAAVSFQMKKKKKSYFLWRHSRGFPRNEKKRRVHMGRAPAGTRLEPPGCSVPTPCASLSSLPTRTAQGNSEEGTNRRFPVPWTATCLSPPKKAPPPRAPVAGCWLAAGAALCSYQPPAPLAGSWGQGTDIPVYHQFTFYRPASPFSF